MSYKIPLNEEGLYIILSEDFEFKEVQSDFPLHDDKNLDKIKDSLSIIKEGNSISLQLKGFEFAEINVTENDGPTLSNTPITNFSLKHLLSTNNEEVVEIYPVDDRYSPKTDLHTHFAGILSAEELCEIASYNNLTIPRFILDELEIDPEKNNYHDLSDKEQKKLESLLSFPIDTQATFIDMEKIYGFRSFIMKDFDLFEDIMYKIGDKYEKEGLKYAEISLSSITEPEYIEKISQ